MGKRDDRQAAHTGATIVIAIVVFCICAFASAVLVAHHRDKIDALLSQWGGAKNNTLPKKAALTPVQVRKGDAISPWSMRRLLATPEIALSRPEFSLADRFARTDFCALFRSLPDSKRFKWDQTDALPSSGDCAGQMDPPARNDDSIHNSLFVQVRRNAAGASAMVRLKLIYLPDRPEPAFRDEFIRGATAALDAVFAIEPEDVRKQIEALTPFNVALSGLNVKLFEEQLVPGAYNLMIEARCGKYACVETNPFYSLSMPRNAPTAEAPAAIENSLQ